MYIIKVAPLLETKDSFAPVSEIKVIVCYPRDSPHKKVEMISEIHAGPAKLLGEGGTSAHLNDPLLYLGD